MSISFSFLKFFLAFLLIRQGSPFAQFAAVATLPSAVSDELFARCKLGVSRFSRCCHLISDLFSISKIEVGPGVRRSHRNSALGFRISCFLSFNRFTSLCGCHQHTPAGTVERFVNLAIHPTTDAATPLIFEP